MTSVHSVVVVEDNVVVSAQRERNVHTARKRYKRDKNGN